MGTSSDSSLFGLFESEVLFSKSLLDAASSSNYEWSKNLLNLTFLFAIIFFAFNDIDSRAVSLAGSWTIFIYEIFSFTMACSFCSSNLVPSNFLRSFAFSNFWSRLLPLLADGKTISTAPAVFLFYARTLVYLLAFLPSSLVTPSIYSYAFSRVAKYSRDYRV